MFFPGDALGGVDGRPITVVGDDGDDGLRNGELRVVLKESGDGLYVEDACTSRSGALAMYMLCTATYHDSSAGSRNQVPAVRLTYSVALSPWRELFYRQTFCSVLPYGYLCKLLKTYLQLFRYNRSLLMLFCLSEARVNKQVDAAAGLPVANNRCRCKAQGASRPLERAPEPPCRLACAPFLFEDKSTESDSTGHAETIIEESRVPSGYPTTSSRRYAHTIVSQLGEQASRTTQARLRRCTLHCISPTQSR